jgi:hypothetical protein
MSPIISGRDAHSAYAVFRAGTRQLTLKAFLSNEPSEPPLTFDVYLRDDELPQHHRRTHLSSALVYTGTYGPHALDAVAAYANAEVNLAALDETLRSYLEGEP